MRGGPERFTGAVGHVLVLAVLLALTACTGPLPESRNEEVRGQLDRARSAVIEAGRAVAGEVVDVLRAEEKTTSGRWLLGGGEVTRPHAYYAVTTVLRMPESAPKPYLPQIVAALEEHGIALRLTMNTNGSFGASGHGEDEAIHISVSETLESNWTEVAVYVTGPSIELTASLHDELQRARDPEPLGPGVAS